MSNKKWNRKVPAGHSARRYCIFLSADKQVSSTRSARLCERSRMHSASLSLSVSVLLTFISFNASALYNVVDPGAVFSDATCEAYAINRTGTVVGLCRTNLGSRAFLWSEDRGSIDLSLLLGHVSAAASGR